ISGFRLPAKEGMAKLEKQAQWLEHEYPSAAASLREGLAEMFTVNRLELSPRLARCLCSTNVIESPHSGVRRRTRRVCRWRDGKMVLRWAAAALLMTESNFRRIMGYRDLWMLAAALGRKTASSQEKGKAAENESDRRSTSNGLWDIFFGWIAKTQGIGQRRIRMKLKSPTEP